MPRSGISRRDFIRLAGAATSAFFMLPSILSRVDSNIHRNPASRHNIIMILFDAMSARNLSVYGYSRQTSPNFERFAERAVVYHSHTSGGNFTIPGTSSLLTGTYPWTHRAINYSGQVKSSMVQDNIFHAIGDDYHRLTFGQNPWAQFILTQFANDIDTLVDPGAFSQLSYLIGGYLKNDENVATRALDDFVFKMEKEPASLVFGPIQRALYYHASSMLNSEGYTRGIPRNASYPLYFRLEDLFNGIGSLLLNLEQPSFAYLHLFPPHAPYRSTDRFFDKFLDRWVPVKKPIHRFSDGLSNQVIKTARRSYDEYIASLDWEFGKLLDKLEDGHVFENSYVILSSDHGEMFERGEKAHTTPLLYDPIVHIPLLISAPGQTARRDIYSPTSAVDILPTLSQIAGKPVPSWGEGKMLPGLGGAEDMERSIFVVEAKNSVAFRPLNRATISMRKGNYKLIYYTGYEAEDSFELYDLGDDIEELKDLFPDQPVISKQLKDELLESFFAANKPYMK